MSDRKIIAVVGATGAQGGGVVRAIAAHPDGGFSARAITRDPSSDAAKALAALPNVEVVQADADDEASLERAFAGCHGAFCVTFFWVDFSPEHEMAQARNMAAAAKAAGVHHVVWSTLEDTRRFVTDDRMPTLQGKYKVPHFDGKEDADAAFREAGVPTTFLRTAFYWENFIYFGLGPARGEDGVLALTFPMGTSRLPGMAAAAKAAGVRHVIWSTLEDTRKFIPLADDRMPTLMGRYKVPHFDAKGESDHFFTDAGVPTTFLHTSFYWDNLIHFGMGPKKGPDGKYAFTLPMGDKKMPGIAAEDIGKCALGIFKAGDRYIGGSVGISGENLTGGQMAASLSRALSRDVVYNAVPSAVYRGFGFPGADDLGNMFQFYADFEGPFCASRDPALARSLNPDLQTFDAWLAANGARIPLD